MSLNESKVVTHLEKLDELGHREMRTTILEDVFSNNIPKGELNDIRDSLIDKKYLQVEVERVPRRKAVEYWRLIKLDEPE